MPCPYRVVFLAEHGCRGTAIIKFALPSKYADAVPLQGDISC
ncbi:hypothetical protein [Microseira wollei]|nr:hypothetical protein [Microseira wollei]